MLIEVQCAFWCFGLFLANVWRKPLPNCLQLRPMMASSKVLEHLTCGICRELYDRTDRKPRVFACGHTFCSDCSKKGETAARQQRLQWTCFVCRTPATTRAESLPISYALMDVAEEIKPLPPWTECKEFEPELVNPVVCVRNTSDAVQVATLLSVNTLSLTDRAEIVTVLHRYVGSQLAEFSSSDLAKICQQMIAFGRAEFLDHDIRHRVGSFIGGCAKAHPDQSEPVLQSGGVLFLVSCMDHIHVQAHSSTSPWQVEMKMLVLALLYVAQMTDPAVKLELRRLGAHARALALYVHAEYDDFSLTMLNAFLVHMASTPGASSQTFHGIHEQFLDVLAAILRARLSVALPMTPDAAVNIRGVVATTCQLISCIAQVDAHAASIARHIPMMLRTLQAYEFDVVVARRLTEAIRSVLLGPHEHVNAFVEAGGCQVISSLIHRHCANREIVLFATSCLNAVTGVHHTQNHANGPNGLCMAQAFTELVHIYHSDAALAFHIYFGILYLCQTESCRLFFLAKIPPARWGVYLDHPINEAFTDVLAPIVAQLRNTLLGNVAAVVVPQP